MNKIYLYRIKTKKTIGEFYKSFKNFDTKNSKFSFNVEYFNKDILEVKSFEKIKSKIKVISPNGDLNFIEYETYQNIIFSLFIYQENLYLATHNPPRSVRSFFNLFSLIAGQGYSIEELNFNLSSFADYFTAKYNCSIKFVEIEKISLNHQSYANVEVFSSGNALEDFNEFIEKNNLNLNKISIKINNLFSDQSITFCKKGIIQSNFYDSSLALSSNEIFKYIIEIISLE